MKKTKNIAGFLSFIAVAAAVYAWSYPMNRGFLEVQTDTGGVEIHIDDQKIPCEGMSCKIRLKSGSHQILASREKHTAVKETVLIERGKTTVFKADLKRVYTLDESNVVPRAKKPSRAVPAGLQTIGSAWNADQTRLVYLDAKDGRVKVWQENLPEERVTLLANIVPPLYFSWFPDEKTLLVHRENDLYFIDLPRGARRKTVLDFKPQNLTPDPKSRLALAADETGILYKIHAPTETVEKTDLRADLKQSAWIDENTILLAVSDAEKKRTDIKTYQPETDRVVTLTVKFGFLSAAMHYDAENQTVYLQKDNDGKWYELKLGAAN